MTQISTVQVIPPTHNGRADKGEGRELVVANPADAGPFRRPLFTHAGTDAQGARPTVSAPFLAQHLDQEWGVGNTAAAPHAAANAYASAAVAPASRSDIAAAA